MRLRVSTATSPTALLSLTTSIGRTTDLDIYGTGLHTPRSSVDRPRREQVMQSQVDPTFYRSPGEAIAAPPERLAYVAAYDRAGKAKDAMAVIDVEESSDSFGRVVGWSELPTAGNELHHFGWNACSSALCHQGHGDHGQPLERRYLVVPGLRSSHIYVLDTKPDPRQPQLVRTIEADELAAKAGYSRPHTVHCGPGGSLCSTWAGPTATTAPAGSPCWTTTPSTSSAPGSTTGASSTSPTTAGGTCTTTP